MDKQILDNSRVIRIFGAKIREILNSNASTWQQLKDEIHIQFENVNLRNMKAVIASSKLLLEHPQALLPEGDFNLFVSPKKTKSGETDVDVMGYWDVRNAISAIIKNSGEVAATHFNKDKNYTIKTGKVLKELYKQWLNTSASTIVEETSVEVVTEIVKETVVEITEEESVSEVMEITSNLKLIDIVHLLENMSMENDNINNAIAYLNDAINETDLAEEVIKKKEAEEAEWAEIEKEFNNTMCQIEDI